MAIYDQVLVSEIVAVIHEGRTAVVVVVVLPCLPIRPYVDVIAGILGMSVFNDTRFLVDQTVSMVCQIMEGQVVDVNNTTMTGTGMDYTPSYLCTPVFVDINNYKDILIDSGYYTADQLG